MQTFILNLLGSLMLFYGLFGYISGVVRYVIKKEPLTPWGSNLTMFYAGIGLAILLTV
jgi:predicted membrane channel-forming protein YqfA (hemolysin III family)